MKKVFTVHTTPDHIAAALAYAHASADALRQQLNAADAVQAIVLLQIIKQAHELVTGIAALQFAINSKE